MITSVFSVFGHKNYHYSKLDDFKKREYNKLLNGVKNRAESIDLCVDDYKEIYGLMEAVFNDNPELYYFNAFNYESYSSTNGCRFIPEYVYSPTDVTMLDIKIDSCILRFKQKYIHDVMTDFQKVKAIRDYLFNTVEYDHRKDSEQGMDDKYSAVGALIRKKAVCMGVSCAFKLLCDACGVENLIVTGDAFDFKDDDLHAWNMVKIGGDYYHTDVTCDIGYKKKFPNFCSWFNVPDRFMKRTHQWDLRTYPTCDATKYSYYDYYDLCIKDLCEVKPFVKKRLKQKQTYITFRFDCNMPPNKMIDKEIEKGFFSAFCLRSYGCSISGETNTVHIQVDKGFFG